MVASKRGKTKTVEFLLDRNADIEARGKVQPFKLNRHLSCLLPQFLPFL
jgi:hypothetical protein